MSNIIEYIIGQRNKNKPSYLCFVLNSASWLMKKEGVIACTLIYDWQGNIILLI